MNPLHVHLFCDDIVIRRAVACALRHAETTVTESRVPHPEPRSLFSEDEVPLAVVLELKTEELLDGAEDPALDVLRVLRTAHPAVPVVVLAPRTPEGALMAFRAFDLGAAEVVTIPASPTHVLFAQHHLRKRMLPAVRAVTFGGLAFDRPTPPPAPPLLPVPTPRPVRVIVAGACTGGPKALAEWLGGIHAPLPLPVLVVQHLPTGYTTALARWLRKRTGLDVREAPAEAPLHPGTVWIAPGGAHLEVRCEGGQCSLVTHRGPRETGCRPSIDVLFRSAARACGADVLGVVLSGAGHDGVSGARALRDAGAAVVVQDPQTAAVWELPGAALPFAEAALPLEAIAERVNRHPTSAMRTRPDRPSATDWGPMTPRSVSVTV